QEVRLMSLNQRFDDAQRKWKPDLKRYRDNLNSRNDRTRAAALADIRAVKDPLAGASLIEMYDAEDYPEVRVLWIEVMGRTPGGAVTSAIVRAALEDTDQRVREAARDVLEVRGDDGALGRLHGELHSKDNTRVQLAAMAIERIGSQESMLPLIEALVTEHKFVVTRGNPGATSASFSPTGQGGGGLSAGGSTTVETRKIANSQALSALRKITQAHNVNFQYDEQAWKTWYGALHAPPEVNLRRVP
ncbi:MAG: HEAT repeat domain-containing protein, partial [Planctomycetales bacterium]|nr:HEAT repeat domain-containing protein [Planctomycetales bacterium]